jgi:hypothetical protein
VCIPSQRAAAEPIVTFDADQPGILGTIAVPVISEMVKFALPGRKNLPAGTTRALTTEELFYGSTVMVLGLLTKAFSGSRRQLFLDQLNFSE